MPPPSLCLKTWPSVCRAAQPTATPPSTPCMLSAHAWHHMHRLGLRCLGGPVLPRGAFLGVVDSQNTPVPPQCHCGDRTGRGEATPPRHWLLNLRTAQGQHKMQTLVYFCRVTVVPPSQLSQCPLPPEAPSLQAGEGSRQGTRFPPTRARALCEPHTAG